MSVLGNQLTAGTEEENGVGLGVSSLCDGKHRVAFGKAACPQSVSGAPGVTQVDLAVHMDQYLLFE